MDDERNSSNRTLRSGAGAFRGQGVCCGVLLAWLLIPGAGRAHDIYLLVGDLNGDQVVADGSDVASLMVQP